MSRPYVCPGPGAGLPTTVGPWTFTRSLVVSGPTAEMFFQLYLGPSSP